LKLQCLVTAVIKTKKQSVIINYSIDFLMAVTVTAAIADDYSMLTVSRAAD